MNESIVYGYDNMADFLNLIDNKNPFFGMNVLVTGGTGFIGSGFCQYFLDAGARKVVSFSRRWDAGEKLSLSLKDSRLRIINGDITNYQQILHATKDIDLIVHAAAYKAVDYAEYNSQYCTETNVTGSVNVINAAIENRVPYVFGISTDKACNSVNTYGKTKALMESLFINANNLGKTRFSVARYANVIGSTGSVVPKFVRSMNDKMCVNVTDKDMTRWFFNKDTAINFVIECIVDMIKNENQRGIVYVPKMKSCTIEQLVDAIAEIVGINNPRLNIIGKRPGEKTHESMIAKEERVHEYEDKYLIYPQNASWDSRMHKRGAEVFLQEEYTSLDSEKFAKDELIDVIFDSVMIYE